ncbi:MAG: hypothetical protein ACYC5Q_08840 [Thermoleophilia bacterium]|jgi:hypothetical protein
MAASPIQVRLPEWARSFVERRALDLNTTKTAVIIEAIGCLRAGEVEELSREGYQEMGAFLLREAESGVAVDNETLPEW